MEFLQQLAYDLFDMTNIWSVVVRALIWVGISIVILIATDNPDKNKIQQNTKSYIGLFLMVVAVSTSLIFLLFGMTPQ